MRLSRCLEHRPAEFARAVTEQYHSGDEKIERTEWFRIATFNGLAEVCYQYLTKGRLVYIAGRMQTRHPEDRNGVKRTVTEVVANEMKMLGGVKNGNGEAGDKPGSQTGKTDCDPDDQPL